LKWLEKEFIPAELVWEFEEYLRTQDLTKNLRIEVNKYRRRREEQSHIRGL
jgi:hypothetical protein